MRARQVSLKAPWIKCNERPKRIIFPSDNWYFTFLITTPVYLLNAVIVSLSYLVKKKKAEIKAFVSGIQIEKRFLMKSTLKKTDYCATRENTFFFFLFDDVGHKYTQSCYSSNECASNMQHWPVGFFLIFLISAIKYYCNILNTLYSDAILTPTFITCYKLCIGHLIIQPQ